MAGGVTQAQGVVANDPTIAAITGGTAQFSDGTKAAPSISFASDTAKGFYHRAANVVSMAANGSEIANFGGSGVGASFVTGFGVSSGSDLAVAGADTHLVRGSAGVWKFSDANSFSANGSVATVLGSVGPTGSHTTVQKWLTIQDNGATVGYIPVF